VITLKENYFRIKLGNDLERHSRKTKQKIWRSASEDILTSRKNRPEVNVGEISRNSKEGSRILIPGKVLGTGRIDHKVTVGAYSFSKFARVKITSQGGSCLSIRDFVDSSPSVKDVVLLG
jgi:large subunit ribosomal protein L18e